jgi:hypothetical protein
MRIIGSISAKHDFIQCAKREDQAKIMKSGKSRIIRDIR